MTRSTGGNGEGMLARPAGHDIREGQQRGLAHGGRSHVEGEWDGKHRGDL